MARCTTQTSALPACFMLRKTCSAVPCSVLARSLAACHGQVQRARVLQVDRVQHQRLWTKYRFRRREIVEAAGRDKRAESFLFHASHPGEQNRSVASVQARLCKRKVLLPSRSFGACF